MNRALVVIDHTDRSGTLLAEANELAAAAGAELVALSLLTDDEYEDDVDVFAAIESVERTTFHMEPEPFATRLGETITKEVLGAESIVDEIVGRVVPADEQADAILEVAREYDCDHLFLVGRRRSPTGKVLFGNTAQSVILNFDGYVTITIE